MLHPQCHVICFSELKPAEQFFCHKSSKCSEVVEEVSATELEQSKPSLSFCET